MIEISNGCYIIGFDNGYQFGKTASTLFDNGVYAMGKVEPSIKENSLKYERKYYKVGEGRAAITEDKVSDENARLLTMVAIAKELSAVGVKKAEIVLAVGLPFSDYGREKKRVIEYYNEKTELKYEFEGTRYDIKIIRVFVFPQCYSAIAPRLGNMKEDYLVVDIGSKTTDVVYLRNGLPVESKSITIEKAMVKWMKQIQSNLQIQYGKNIPEKELLKVILKQGNFLSKSHANLVRDTIADGGYLYFSTSSVVELTGCKFYNGSYKLCESKCGNGDLKAVMRIGNGSKFTDCEFQNFELGNVFLLGGISKEQAMSCVIENCSFQNIMSNKGIISKQYSYYQEGLFKGKWLTGQVNYNVQNCTGI